MKYENPLSLIGNTPLVRVRGKNAENLYLKLEGTNPTGSLKDRTAFRIVMDLIERGTLHKGATLLDASSGSYACSLAFVARELGYGVTVVVNAKISQENLAFLHMIGATVIQHGAVTGEGRDYCLRLMNDEPGKYVFADQLTNPSSPAAHRSSTGPEILLDVPDVAAVVASMGSGATLLGVASYLKKIGSKAKIIASVATPGDEKKIAGTYLRGVDLDSPFIQELREKSLVDLEVPVLYRQAMENAASLAQSGILVGPQGGGVLAAALQGIQELGITGPVVAIAGDTMLKNASRYG